MHCRLPPPNALKVKGAMDPEFSFKNLSGKNFSGSGKYSSL
jgi:hypothetical protein